jgi:integrating conjugative element protein (TIGR03765 family)
METLTMNSTKCLLLACLSFFLPGLALSEPEIIYDSGNTKPTGIHLKEHRIQLSETPKAPGPGNIPIVKYPVTTTKLSVGQVEPKAVKLPLGFHPVFIVGNDELSRQWLQIKHDRLLELRAVGILIEVKSQEDLEELQKRFPKLVFMPMSVDGIAENLPVKHYPVLITRDRVEQ